MRNNSSIIALRDCITLDICSKNLHVVMRDLPNDGGFWGLMAQAIFGIDGDSSLLWKTLPNGHRKKTALLRDLEGLDSICRFDRKKKGGFITPCRKQLWP